jgi:hypothetical protein
MRKAVDLADVYCLQLYIAVVSKTAGGFKFLIHKFDLFSVI